MEAKPNKKKEQRDRRYQYPLVGQLFGKRLCRLIFGKDAKKISELELSPEEFFEVSEPYISKKPYLRNLFSYHEAYLIRKESNRFVPIKQPKCHLPSDPPPGVSPSHKTE